MRWCFLVFLLAASVGSDARVYQWNDPRTGTAYLSGVPPAWYRSGTDGPRVMVFEAGKLVDDTAEVLSAEEEQARRTAALQAAEAERAAELERLTAQQPESGPEEPAPAAGEEEDAVAIFRALISAWDQRNQGGGTAPPPQPAAPAGP